jgi:Holliday junction resolvase
VHYILVSGMQNILVYQTQTYETLAQSSKRKMQYELEQVYTRVNRIRRNRGYSFEHVLVQKLNSNVWNARRLGGSSANLPDIIAVNNKESVFLSIEAKSGTSDSLYVPSDQIQRCFQIRDMFRVYKTAHVILAFKFMQKRRVREEGKTVYAHRKLQEYYKVADRYSKIKDLPVIKCTYDGNTFELRNNQSRKCYLKDYVMPF